MQNVLYILTEILTHNRILLSQRFYEDVILLLTSNAVTAMIVHELISVFSPEYFIQYRY